MMKDFIKSRVAGGVTAFRLLSLLPMPGEHAFVIERAHGWFPVVGGVLGAALVLTGWGVMVLTGAWAQASAFVMLGLGAVLTRGFHLDGLSDWADGFWGGFTPERRLAIMKDSRVGAFGVIVLILFLLGKWAAFVRIAAVGAWGWIVVAMVLSRAMQVLIAWTQPYARTEGGTGALFVSSVTMGGVRITMGLAAGLLLILRTADLALLIAALGAVVITVLFGISCKRSVGGVTGDLIGTCSEFVELWVLLVGGTAL